MKDREEVAAEISRGGVDNLLNAAELANRLIIRPDLTLDATAGLLMVGNRTVLLRRKESELLEYLCENSGKVLSRDGIYSAVWSGERYGSKTVDVHVAALRRKIGGVDFNLTTSPIKTIRALGYLMVAAEDLKS